MSRRWEVFAPSDVRFQPVQTWTRRGARRWINRKARAYLTVPEIVYSYYRVRPVAASLSHSGGVSGGSA